MPGNVYRLKRKVATDRIASDDRASKRVVVMDPTTTHRVVEVRWLPRTEAEWAVFTAARAEAARLWNTMAEMHAVVRRCNLPWPSLGQWNRWAKGRFPALSAQTVQQIVAEFCATLHATTKARRTQKAAGDDVTARYPWRTPRYRDVSYTNQDARIRGGILRLSHGRGGNAALSITLPVDRALPGRLMEVSLAFGVIRLVCEVPARAMDPNAPRIGVDLGVNTLAAATDGQKVVLVSGRVAKALVQYRNKCQAELSSRIDVATKGSQRRKRLVRAKYRMLDRQARQLKDVLHKTTRTVAEAFPDHHAIVGKPFNDAARRMGRRQAQQVSSASNAVLIAMLAYKMAGATEVPEPYSSQTCPGCGCRQKCRRVYQCKECGLSLPRDAVGSVNIRRIEVVDAAIPTAFVWVRPLRKYPATPRGAAGSSGGTPARSAA
jgi:putative transposase